MADHDHHYLTEDSMPVEWLSAIATAPADYVSEMILADFARAQRPELRKIAAKVAIKYRLDRTTHGGDVQSLVDEAFLLVIKDVREGLLTVDEITSFSGMVSYRAKSLVRTWIDSSAGMNNASRQVSLKRRIKEMRQTRDQILVERGVEPTPEQVIDATNARMEEHRKDAKRQGMWCTTEDYQIMMSGPSAELGEIAETSTPDPNEHDGALHAAERDTLVKLTIAKCFELSELHGKVAEAFFGDDLAASFDKPPTSAEIAELIGIAPPTVRRKIAEVKQVAQEVLKTYFGITGVDG